ncbi:NAD(P)/FAD-dependent oxidoreductase [Ensifer aridi]|uniref:NAD(P)/FAD-dependent oxidoreductase n=1 Tax=Ensifer aridi TaxID=1708715 RepID=UPI000A120742|nr:FAD-binding oxidoreductase [Ensifer aridi]
MRNLYQHSCKVSIETPRLDRAITADAVIVGGGYTGLSTALHLALRGLNAVVIEAGDIGNGCSGRNGGQVNPGLKLPPNDVEGYWGHERGKRMVELSYSAPDVVFSLIEQHGIDCAPARTGTIRAAIDKPGVAQVQELAEQCRNRGGEMSVLGPDEMERMTGTSIYLAGTLDPRGGHINPMAYARGLGLAAQRAGAQLYSQSPALGLQRTSAGWQVTTRNGSVSAAKLIVATNGYTDDLWPGLKKTIAPVYTYIAATEPLSKPIRERIMPSRAALFEAAWDVVYYRIDDEGRLLVGGRGPQRNASSQRDYHHLIKYACKLWPELQGVDWPWGWYGQVAITNDHLPHLTVPDDNAYLMLGYSGRGIAMATVAGQQIATLIASENTADIDIPVRKQLSFMPFQRFWRIGANASIAYHLLRDKLRGR